MIDDPILQNDIKGTIVLVLGLFLLISMIVFAIPSDYSTVLLNATSVSNLTGENLTVYISGSDATTNITDWRVDADSLAAVHLHFFF